MPRKMDVDPHELPQLSGRLTLIDVILMIYIFNTS